MLPSLRAANIQVGRNATAVRVRPRIITNSLVAYCIYNVLIYRSTAVRLRQQHWQHCRIRSLRVAAAASEA